MKPFSTMILICIFVFGLIFVVSTPEDIRDLRSASNEIIQVVERNIVFIWDKLHGIDDYYIDDDESTEDDPFEIELGDGEIFDSEHTINVKAEWDFSK